MFSNIGSDANIDWATLAQQWIQRNIKGNETMEAPPPPNIGQSYRARNYSGFDEKGEEDMDMDDDELPPPAPPMMPVSSGDANLLQFPLQAAIGDVEPDQTASWNTWMNPPNPILSQQFPKSSPTAHIPSLMKMTVPNPNDLTKIEESVIENTCTTIDAAKRKVLPAWIREGLEKMEREKQRQLERQQLKERNDDKPIATTTSVALATDITVKDNVVKSLESGDSSGNEQEDDDLPYKLKNTNKSKHIGNIEPRTVASSGVSNDDDDAAAPALYVGKSYEQRLADLMILVRRTLTELLLEVTNDEIAQIAKETLNSSKLKGLAAYSSSGDESDSDNSAISENEESRDGYRRRSGTSTAAEDSEEEIRAKLRVRRRAFAKTTEEIEEYVAKNAVREEQKLRYYKQKEQLNKQDNESDDEKRDVPTEVSTAKFGGIGKNNNARDFGETTTESKLQQSNGKKSKERSSRRGERTTRFSDNKDSKNVVAVTATYLSQLNPTAGTTTVTPTAANAIHGFQIGGNSNSAGLTDVNTNMHSFYTPTAAAAAGISSMLSAAEAAIEKASKTRNSTTSLRSVKSNDRRDHETRRRRQKDSRRRSSEDTDSSSSSNNSTDSSSSSYTSRDSKYSRASSNSTSRHKRSNHSSSSSHYRSDRYEDQRRHHHKRHRDDHDERAKSRHSSSSKYSSTHRHERSRDRSRSRSRSTYSSSSSKRHRNRH